MQFFLWLDEDVTLKSQKDDTMYGGNELAEEVKWMDAGANAIKRKKEGGAEREAYRREKERDKVS
ncbi:sensor histidine kinase [Sesbania bispinosa]|nr:sensor histidine kinase [Sesbania bispinosa]